MRIAIAAIGRLGRAPEAALAEDYARRATAAGRALGLGPVEILEIEAREAMTWPCSSQAITSSPGPSAASSASASAAFPGLRAFAGQIGALRDGGTRRLVYLIGGSDGLGEAALDRAGRKLAFGPQTWPHALARAMLAEQVYRAATILAGSPYHRD